MSIVLDSFALMAWLLGEPAAPKVREWLVRAEQKEVKIFVSIVNLGEVYYRLQKLRRIETAQEFIQDIQSGGLPLNMAPAVNRRVWAAARLKARYPIAYADGFAAALAQELHCPLLTGDRDFEVLDRAKVIQIEWLPVSGAGRA